jgi:hypothetical protein
MTNLFDIRNSTFEVCPIQRLYSILRSLFFWLKMSTARRDQHEETGSALSPWHKVRRPVDQHDRLMRKVRWEQLDEDLAYQPNELDRAVIAPIKFAQSSAHFAIGSSLKFFPAAPPSRRHLSSQRTTHTQTTS